MKILRYSLAVAVCLLNVQPGFSDDLATKKRLAERIVNAQEAPGRTLHPEFRRRAVESLVQRPLGELQTAAENLTIIPLALGDSTSDIVYTTLQ